MLYTYIQSIVYYPKLHYDISYYVMLYPVTLYYAILYYTIVYYYVWDGSAAATVKAKLHQFWWTYVASAVHNHDSNGRWLLSMEWML